MYMLIIHVKHQAPLLQPHSSKIFKQNGQCAEQFSFLLRGFVRFSGITRSFAEQPELSTTWVRLRFAYTMIRTVL